MRRNWKWKKTQKNVSELELCWIWKYSSDLYDFYIPTIRLYTFLFSNFNLMLFILLRAHIFICSNIKLMSFILFVVQEKKTIKNEEIYLSWIVLLFMYLTKWYACCSCYICTPINYAYNSMHRNEGRSIKEENDNEEEATNTNNDASTFTYIYETAMKEQ